MNTNIIRHFTLEVAEGEELSITKGKKDKIDIPFRMIGSGVKMNSVQSVNILREMETLSRPAQRLLNILIDKMIYDPIEREVIVKIHYVPEDDTGKMLVKKGYKELFDRDLVRRIKRGQYVVNPFAVITKNKEHILLWNSIKIPKKKKDLTTTNNSPKNNIHQNKATKAFPHKQ